MAGDAAFGRRLREVREERGLSREQLAERVGAGNQKTVWAHESGRKDPHLAIVRRYAAALGVSAARLVEEQR
jgi:transcriptional regulator with XRE-family HTH domain